MKGITFGDYHSYDDFSLLLVSKEVGSPSVKVREIEIPGADGTLDLTDFFGEAKYENVTHKFQFQTIVPQANFLSLFSTIKNAIHGKKQRIILDDDPSFYYLGRCFVSAFTNEKNIGTISVECVCEPWKYKVNQTNTVVSLSGKNLFDCQNLVANDMVRVGATYSSLETGVRITTTRQGRYPYVLFKVIPSTIVIGKTITVSWSEATGEYIVVVGYAENFSDFIKIQETAIENSVKMTVDKSHAERYKYVAVWLYAGRNITVETGVFSDYIDLQVEIGDTATSFEPYERELRTSIVSIDNSKKHVIPEIFASKAITISKDSYSASLQAERTYQFPEFELTEGNNEFTITGTDGLISFKYQEGGL